MDHQIQMPLNSEDELFLQSYNFFWRYYKRKESHYKQTYQDIYVKKKSVLFKSGARFTQVYGWLQNTGHVTGVEFLVSTFRRVEFFVLNFRRVEFLVSTLCHIRLISLQIYQSNNTIKI